MVIKIISCWKDNPGRTPEENERHYRDVHMEMARRLFDGVDGFVGLVYNRVRRAWVYDYNTTPPVDRAESDMDAYVELYFRDQESLDKAFQKPELAELFDDHVHFMHTDMPASIRGYELDEDVYFGTRPTR